MTINVCHNCQDRYTACWGACEKYLAARKELEKRKAEKLKERRIEGAVNAVQYNALRKYRRLNNGK